MKTLNQFINEALFNLRDYDRVVKARTTVTPKNREELLQIIEDTIKKEGIDCDLNFIDTSEITDMSYLFAGSDFNGDISKWDVSNVQNMYKMFHNSEFNGDLSKWDVANVKDMDRIFDGCDLSDVYGDIPKIEHGHFVKK